MTTIETTEITPYHSKHAYFLTLHILLTYGWSMSISVDRADSQMDRHSLHYGVWRINMYVCMFEGDISIMFIMCDDSDVTEYDRRTLELSNAALHIKQDTLH